MIADSGGILINQDADLVSDWSTQHGQITRTETFEIPKGLTLRLSESSESGKSVWSTHALPRGATFGPKDFTEMPTGQHSTNEWMRYIEETECDKQHNVLPFLLIGKVYYRAIKHIEKDTKLLIWYGSKCKCPLHEGEESDNDAEEDEDEDDSCEEEISQPCSGEIPFPLPPRQPEQLSYPSVLSEPPQPDNDLEESNSPVGIEAPEEITENLLFEAPETDDSQDINEFEDGMMPSEPQEYDTELDNIETPATELEEDNTNEITVKMDPEIVCNLEIKDEFDNEGNDEFITSYEDGFSEPIEDEDSSSTKSKRKRGKFQSTNKKIKAKAIKKVKQEHRTFICDECGKEFKKVQELKQHMQVHTKEKLFECEVCGKKYGRKGTLKQHSRSHDGDQGRIHTCDTCGKAFNKRSSLNAHLRIHSGVKPYMCEVCTKAFTNLSDLRRHSRLHTSFKMMACHICGKEFSELKKHLKTHLKEKKCLTCDKFFDNAGSLRMHIKSHKDEVINLCLKCGMGFDTVGELHEHQPSHASEYPHICETCGQCFSSGSELKYHMMAHTGELPLRCAICNKGFARSGHYQRHMKMHAGERKYLCGTCGKGLTSAVDLKRHMSLHTGSKPFQCPSCPKAFAVHVDLKRHEKSHLSLKPYACDMCENRYCRTEHLRKHIQKVHENPPVVFNCNICQRIFQKEVHLDAHNRTCHGQTTIEEEQTIILPEQLFSFFV